MPSAIDTLVVATNGTSAAIEQARGALDSAYPSTFAPQTMGELQAGNTREIDGYRQLADVVILTSLPIAGCSLAVNIAGGLAERKRPFSLLRLAGAPLAMLRRVIALEAAAPLLITALASIGVGLLTAQLFLRAQLRETLQPPGLQYYVVIVAGLLASIAGDRVDPAAAGAPHRARGSPKRVRGADRVGFVPLETRRGGLEAFGADVDAYDGSCPRVRKRRTSCGQPQAVAIFAAHRRASCSSGTSTTAKPPRYSFDSTYGPSVNSGVPLAASTLNTGAAGSRPPVNTSTPAVFISSTSDRPASAFSRSCSTV